MERTAPHAKRGTQPLAAPSSAPLLPAPAATALWQLQCLLTAKERRLAFDLLSEQSRTHGEDPNPLGLAVGARAVLESMLAAGKARLRHDHRERLLRPETWNHEVIGIDELTVSCGKSPVRGAPLALSFRGDGSAFQTKSVAIIGSRQPTYQGRRLAHDYARTLSAAGFFIWSGGAIGIDTVALLGGLSLAPAMGSLGHDTLAQKARVGAILGSGLDCPYPPSNRQLFGRPDVVTVSEFEPHLRAQPWCFPLRNFTLAWLADYVLVIESQRNSGSLITADCAAQLGRGVGALVWPGDHPLASGNQSLLETGADPIMSPEGLLGTLGTLAALPGAAQKGQGTAAPVHL